MKRTIAAIAVLLLLCLPVAAFAEGGSETEQTGIAAISALHQAWKDSAGNIVYPEDYAGAYLDENQQAVVCIVNLSTAREDELKALVLNARIKFKTAKYSYQELKRIQEEIGQDKNAPLTVPDALGVGLDERNNVIEITVNIADEAAARPYYEEKYGDRITVTTTGAAVYLPQTGSVSALLPAAMLLLLGAGCTALAGKRNA